MDGKIENLVIIGSGPAAHTAAIYSSRAQLNPILYEGLLAGGIPAGGQLTTTTCVENYPGFELISGTELMENMRSQSVKFGTRIITETVVSVDLSKNPFVVRSESGTTSLTRSIIVASGATARMMEVEGAKLSNGSWKDGISACAVCDGPLTMFRNKPLAVVGGGDSAVEEAIFLTKYAEKVYIIHRRDQLRASKYMEIQARNNSKIEIMYSHILKSINGERCVNGIVLLNLKTNEERVLDVSGLFYAIGHIPNTSFLDRQLDLDDNGYVITKPNSTKTSVEGVFAAGDVMDPHWRQAVVAAASGCIAAFEVERFLNTSETVRSC